MRIAYTNTSIKEINDRPTKQRLRQGILGLAKKLHMAALMDAAAEETIYIMDIDSRGASARKNRIFIAEISGTDFSPGDAKTGAHTVPIRCEYRFCKGMRP